MKKAAKKVAPTRRRAATVKYPSKASLREMPERAEGARSKRNKFAAQIAKDGGLLYEVDGEKPRWVPLPQGRPKTGVTVEPSKPRSVRLPDTIWEELQARARSRGVGVHTLLRKLVAEYLKKAA